MFFSLDGPFKPYVRMTQRGKFVRPEAQAYLASKDALTLQFKQQMNGREIIGRAPLKVNIGIYHNKPYHNRDLDNEIKAILDAAQGIVFENDCWIDAIDAERMPCMSDAITVEITLV